MVDAVSEVLEIPASDIEPPPSFGARIRADFIEGMGKVAASSSSCSTSPGCSRSTRSPC
jgi:chemotaxis signal transduction protein